MQYQQSVSNIVAKRGNSSEMNKWRDAGVDPELLYDVEPAVQPLTDTERLHPHVAEWDGTLLAREAARQGLVNTVKLEQV